MNQQTIANWLTEKGYTITKQTELDDEVDGAVYLNEFPDAHIQIGYDYMLVVKETKDGSFIFYPERNAVLSLIDDMEREQHPALELEKYHG